MTGLDRIVTGITLIGTPAMRETPFVRLDRSKGEACSECLEVNCGFDPFRPPYVCPIRGERCAGRPVPA